MADCSNVTLNLLRLVPDIIALLATKGAKEEEMPLCKFVPSKSKQKQLLVDAEGDDMNCSVGYSAALEERKASMEGHGMQVNMPSLSKEQKKAEKDKKKVLNSAKHLVK